MAQQEFTLTSIGIFHTSQVHPYEAGRQPDAHHSEGRIELHEGSNFEQALTGLEGCERIWIVFLFHHNAHWNPMVLPPRGTNSKIGVFATRSPYRPNPIGISCVKVKKISNRTLVVEGADLLDQTPILDIKPYVAYADSFPGVEPQWLQGAQKYSIEFSSEALAKLTWLEDHGLAQLRSFLLHQLEYEPSNEHKKRVKKSSSDQYIIAYRTWRAAFLILWKAEGSNTSEPTSATVKVFDIFSGYSAVDLQESAEDKYQDKDLHRQFNEVFMQAHL